MDLLKKNNEKNKQILSKNDNLKDKRITNFYKKNPFPNYKNSDDKFTILEKGNNNVLLKQFKKFAGNNKKILEVGCGTGQVSNYLAIGTNHEITGLDSTIESLYIAKNFNNKNNIKNVKFICADIFDEVLFENYFDFIFCNGVLHHTKNPYKAFEIISISLKNEGYILLGLYNKIGRLRTVLRKYLSKIFILNKFSQKFLEYSDPTLRNLKIDDQERKAWINDQYYNPIESLHTLDEVLKWFKKNNINYINSIPSCDLNSSYAYENIFEKKSTGNLVSRIFNQILMIFNSLGSDGGIFIVIGQKNEAN